MLESSHLSSPAHWRRLVDAARSLGDPDRCLDLLNDGLLRFGDDAQVHLFAGETFAALGLFMESLQSYDSAARAQTTDPRIPLQALLCGAALLAELGYYDEAMTRFHAAETVDRALGVESGLKAGHCERQTLSELQRDWSRLAGRLGNRAEAEGALENAIALSECAESQRTLAEFLLEKGEAAKALEHLERGRQLGPRRADFQNLAARCYFILGRSSLAKDALVRGELLGDDSRTGVVLRAAAQGWS